MNTEKIIRDAINDMQLAEDMRSQANELYYRAKKKLESVCSSAFPPLKPIKRVDMILEKRNSKVKNYSVMKKLNHA